MADLAIIRFVGNPYKGDDPYVRRAWDAAIGRFDVIFNYDTPLQFPPTDWWEPESYRVVAEIHVPKRKVWSERKIRGFAGRPLFLLAAYAQSRGFTIDWLYRPVVARYGGYEFVVDVEDGWHLEQVAARNIEVQPNVRETPQGNDDQRAT